MKKNKMKKRIKKLEREIELLKDDNKNLQEMWSYNDKAIEGVIYSLVGHLPDGLLDDSIKRIREKSLLYVDYDADYEV